MSRSNSTALTALIKSVTLSNCLSVLDSFPLTMDAAALVSDYPSVFGKDSYRPVGKSLLVRGLLEQKRSRKEILTQPSIFGCSILGLFTHKGGQDASLESRQFP